jgi:hypothetical protein
LIIFAFTLWYIKVNAIDTRDGDLEADLWNIRVLAVNDLKWFVIPHDFNFSAVILGQNYFVLSQRVEMLGTPDLRKKVVEELIIKEKKIRELAELIKNTDKDYYDSVTRSLNGFYSQLKSKSQL